ncbi:MAG: hypothetical protein JSR98_06790 [Proteobacteria bacterium]|nr:hypothetical protein [Pseudomonadota bacterium]
MANLEREIAGEVLRSARLGASGLGLRFDRVVGRVLGDLRAFAEQAVPEPLGVALTLTAPIRLPAKTLEAVRARIQALTAQGRAAEDLRETLHGNDLRLRLVRRAAGRPKLIGFVHSPDQDAARLLDLAARGLEGERGAPEA